MKIVTYNIRTSDRGSRFDGENSFDFRAPLIREVIPEEAPEVLCFQETRPYQVEWLIENFPEYIFLGCGRDVTLANDEAMLVGLKNGAFRIIAMDTFWLSPTPEIPGSRYEDQSSCPRCATEVLVQYKKTGQLYNILNTHLDHISSSARVLGSTAVLEHLRSSAARFAPFGPVKTLLFGDFNALPEEPEITMITADGKLRDITAESGITYHGYDLVNGDLKKIDYIFASTDVTCSEMYRWMQTRDGVFLSDHYPICAVIDE